MRERQREGERKRERKKRRGCVWREMWWGRLEIERERARWLRGEDRCSAELEWTPRAQPSARCHGNHIPPPPASLQTVSFFTVSLSLSSSSMLFTPLLICVSVSLDFCHFLHASRTHLWRRTLGGHIGFDAVHSVSRWMGSRTVYFAIQCTWARKHWAVFAASLYFYFPLLFSAVLQQCPL